MRKPIKVTDADIAFGGSSKMKELLPPMSEIPNEFKNNHESKWNDLVNDIFYYGINNAKWVPKPGINIFDAIRHVKTILGSFEPKHEHKMAAAAYLFSEFFESVTYEKEK